MVDVWANQNIQSATGQMLALQIGIETYEKTNKKININDEWPRALVACGLCVKIKESILPKLMLTPDTIGSLEKMLMTDESFRQDLANISSKDPPDVTSAVGDLGNWMLQHVSAVKRAKEL